MNKKGVVTEKEIEIDKKLKIYIQLAENKLEEEEFETKVNLDKFLSFKKIIRLQILDF